MSDGSEPTTDEALAELAISLLDLTDLSDDIRYDGGEADAALLCERARRAGVAAVCVWPAYVAGCAGTLLGTGIDVATVVNFPSGDEPLDQVLADTSRALDDGATEIDVVLPYRAWLAGDTATAVAVLDGVKALVDARPEALMKVIIESGALPDLSAVDRAAMFAIDHGADFVKTSTGKTAVSATPEAAEVILDAIAVSGEPIGFKASGGIRTLDDARTYIDLVRRILGDEWLEPGGFRFGASSLLDALQAAIGDPDAN